MLAATAALCFALLVSACGEKEENLEAVPQDDPNFQTGPVEPGASRVRVEGLAAKELARVTASDAVAGLPGRVAPVDPAAWSVNCAYDDPERVRCRVATPRCRGRVVITPTKVPAGQSAEGIQPRTSVDSLACGKPKRPGGA